MNDYLTYRKQKCPLCGGSVIDDWNYCKKCGEFVGEDEDEK